MTLESEIRPIRAANLLRTMHKVLPRGRHYYPLYALCNPDTRGLVAIPFGKHHILQPVGWRKEVMKFLLTEEAIPDFQIVAPIVQKLERGHLIDVGANRGAFTL